MGALVVILSGFDQKIAESTQLDVLFPTAIEFASDELSNPDFDRQRGHFLSDHISLLFLAESRVFADFPPVVHLGFG